MRQLQHGGLDRLGVPCTSALMSDRDLLLLAGLDAGEHLVERAARGGRHAGRLFAQLAGAELGDLAGAAFVLHRDDGSPADGTPARPRNSTGVEGPASVMFEPCRPAWRGPAHSAPATTMSPCRSVPFWTSTVATGPRPRSSRPRSRALGGAVRIGLEFEHFRLQRDLLGSLSRPLLGRRHLDVLRLAAHLLDHDS